MHQGSAIATAHGAAHRLPDPSEEPLFDEALRCMASLASAGDINAKELERLFRKANSRTGLASATVTKRRMLPYYLRLKASDPKRLAEFGITDEADIRICKALRAKPRRSASGVATVTILAKPEVCSGRCIFCPSDIRMPKSYMSAEPACQRAEKCFFDPYVQVASRLSVLEDMGHKTDKVELIVLGGTWDDYQEDYRNWFVARAFAALNEEDPAERERTCNEVLSAYEDHGFVDASHDDEIRALQQKVDEGSLEYEDALAKTTNYRKARAWHPEQGFALDDVHAEHEINETATHRCVGLVFETRPDKVSDDSLRYMRELGATKVQIGIQSLFSEALDATQRAHDLSCTRHAMELLRKWGFKSHVHYMANFPKTSLQEDMDAYQSLFEDRCLLPDEVKLYPCVLVSSSKLDRMQSAREWVPYSDDELMEFMLTAYRSTPRFTRISRVIRDISATDILAGNKKANLRQEIEKQVEELGLDVVEMRYRELALDQAESSDLRLMTTIYETSNTQEAFLEYVQGNDRLAAFCRLSLPNDRSLPALIRELHVYGRVSNIHEASEGAQHLGLGKALVAEACKLASQDGRDSIRVISAVGTRQYYRLLGFEDDGLYLSKLLDTAKESCAEGPSEQTSTIDFYKSNAEAFSKTRQRPWAGWERFAKALGRLGSGHLSLLDAACGNMRLEGFLKEALPDVSFDFWTIDAVRELAPHGHGTHFLELDLIESLRRGALEEALNAASMPHMDACAVFGFMHHIPSQELRIRLVEAMSSFLADGGLLAMSFWKFADSEAFKAKAMRDTHRAARERSLVADSKNGDYYLGWQGMPGQFRFCHSFADDEIQALAEAAESLGLRLLERYRADGKDGISNDYLILQKASSSAMSTRYEPSSSHS